MVDALLINPRVSMNEKYPPLSLISLASAVFLPHLKILRKYLLKLIKGKN